MYIYALKANNRQSHLNVSTRQVVRSMAFLSDKVLEKLASIDNRLGSLEEKQEEIKAKLQDLREEVRQVVCPLDDPIDVKKINTADDLNELERNIEENSFRISHECFSL